MGKKNNQNAGKQAEQCQSTVYVSNLPYSFTNPQLEETFSDVGPIRRCFMATRKGSTEHRGSGYVHFASSVDSDRAIEMKNGSSVGGRKIAVKQAKPRATLEQRRDKNNRGAQSSDTEFLKKEKPGDVPVNHKVAKDQTLAAKDRGVDVKYREVVVKDHKQGKPNAPKKAKELRCGLADAEYHSGKQRTVIIGGLLNSTIAECALSSAKEIDGVCSIKYPLPQEELEQLGVAQDGCKLEAAAVLYASVQSARAAVTKFHKKEIKDGIIWARQLGGEGSKTQKWKVIVRNLPFKATEDEVREKFSSSGFVWDVSIPRNPDTGLSKGFAFVKFTSKQDAERAIQKFNEQKFHKRTIAVDRAAPKKHHANGANFAVMSEEVKSVESSAVSGSDSDFYSEHDDMEKADEDSHGPDASPDDSEIVEDKVSDTAADFGKEAKLAHKIFQSLITTSNIEISSSANIPSSTADGSLKQSSQCKPKNASEHKVTKSKLTDEDGGLHKAIFISNIPFDVDPEEVRQRFSSFGEVQSFVPVLHKVTGRPSGSAFLYFHKADAVSAAIAGPGPGIFLKGRQVEVREPLDEKSADDIVVKKSKHEDNDRRNVYLIEEGQILEGSPAAEGVSMSDMKKRKNLERKKSDKLRSPNFHVSRTRLVIYNIPKSMNINVFRKLCIDAVTSRAWKQIPTIRQVKFLKDTKRGKIASKNHSRGVAFVEFTKHEHALVALRVLNNNPETFGPEHRPIVEFALDNVQTLRQRNMKIQAQQWESATNEGGSPAEQNDKSKKRKPRGDQNPNPSNEIKKKVLDGEGTSKKRRMDSKNKRKGDHFQDRRKLKLIKDKTLTKGGPKSLNKSVKRKVRDEACEEKAKGVFLEKKRVKTGKNKDPLGIDLFMEQYRSKFTQLCSGKVDGKEQSGGLKLIRGWFESS